MKFKWRKWNRAIHRDFGYFFFGMTLIYAISGFAINHVDDWNPNYVIRSSEIQLPEGVDYSNASKEDVIKLLEEHRIKETYRKHYYPSSSETLKIFLKGGSVSIDLNTNKAEIELLKKRPILNQVNYLHYNPGKWWTIFSDIYASALFLLAITGLFILRGKNGIKGRGAWLTLIGLAIPIVFLLFFR